MADALTTSNRQSLDNSFTIMRNALTLLQMKVEPRMSLEEAEALFKDFHKHILIGMTGAIDLVGGDTLYIPVPDFLSDDIETAFEIARIEEDARAPVFHAPYSTLNHVSQGIAR